MFREPGKWEKVSGVSGYTLNVSDLISIAENLVKWFSSFAEYWIHLGTFSSPMLGACSRDCELVFWVGQAAVVFKDPR